MGGGEVGVVQQARHVVGGAASDGEAVAGHQLQGEARVPGVREVHRAAVEDGDQEGVDHADEVTDRRGGELVAAVGRVAACQLARLEGQSAVTVHNSLGIAGRSGGEGDQRRSCRVRSDDTGQRFGGEQVVEVPSYDADHGDLRAQLGVVSQVPEPFCGDEDLRLDGVEDVADFLTAVEVDDRYYDRAEARRGPEDGRRLHPVGQLERHDVAGADTPLAQSRGQSAGRPFDLAEGAVPGPYRRVDPEGGLRGGRQSPGQQVTDRLPGPPALRLIAVDQFSGDLSHDWNPSRH